MFTLPWYLWVAGVLLVVGILLVGAWLVLWLRSRSKEEYYVEYDTPDYRGDAGFYFVSQPASELLVPHRYWLVNNGTAEIEYEVAASKNARLRAAESGELRIPDDYKYADYESVADTVIDDIPVRLYHNPANRSMATWTQDDFDLVLLIPDPEMNMLNGLANEFVSSTRIAKDE